MKTHRHSGFSLIEVLIAIFVFATGILSLAGLQMKSMSMLSNSHSMSIAMTAVSDMADRMRANPVAMFDGYYDSIDGTETNPDCGNSCSNSQIAQYDAWAVRASLNGELPEPTFSVTNVGSNYFTIEVTWTERIGNNIETKSHRATFVPYKP